MMKLMVMITSDLELSLIINEFVKLNKEFMKLELIPHTHVELALLIVLVASST